MELTNPIEYIVLGGQIRYLAARGEGSVIFGDGMIHENLLSFRRRLEELGFSVCGNLYDAQILPLQVELSSLYVGNANESEILLSKDLAERLSTMILSLEQTVIAEAQTRVIASPVPSLNNSHKKGVAL